MYTLQTENLLKDRPIRIEKFIKVVVFLKKGTWSVSQKQIQQYNLNISNWYSAGTIVSNILK